MKVEHCINCEARGPIMADYEQPVCLRCHAAGFRPPGSLEAQLEAAGAMVDAAVDELAQSLEALLERPGNARPVRSDKAAVQRARAALVNWRQARADGLAALTRMIDLAMGGTDGELH